MWGGLLKEAAFTFSTAIPLSEDHKPNRSDERKRIESAGGVVMWAGKVIYVFSVLLKQGNWYSICIGCDDHFEKHSM